ncbi:hypothetical protein [Reyranella sp.]|uniref:hypothetical protein n=1 Tax=Reyranella sp. TaxID=1929291 RepID=UPI0025E6C5FE|nr:hypothetical protein [Reyranella sp.]
MNTIDPEIRADLIACDARFGTYFELCALGDNGIRALLEVECDLDGSNARNARFTFMDESGVECSADCLTERLTHVVVRDADCLALS